MGVVAGEVNGEELVETEVGEEAEVSALNDLRLRAWMLRRSEAKQEAEVRLVCRDE